MALNGIPSPLIVAHEQHGVACGPAHQTKPSSVAPSPVSGDWEEAVYDFMFLPHITCKGGSSLSLGAGKTRIFGTLK